MIHRFPITRLEYTLDIRQAFIRERLARLDETILELEQVLAQRDREDLEQREDVVETLSWCHNERQREFPEGEGFLLALEHNLGDFNFFYQVSLACQLRQGLRERGIDPGKSLYVVEQDIDPFIDRTGNPHVAVNLPHLRPLFEYVIAPCGSQQEQTATRQLQAKNGTPEGITMTSLAYHAGLVWGSIVCGTDDAHCLDGITFLKSMPRDNDPRGQMAVFVYDENHFVEVVGKHSGSIFDYENVFVHQNTYAIEDSLRAIVHVVPLGNKISTGMVVIREPEKVKEERTGTYIMSCLPPKSI